MSTDERKWKIKQDLERLNVEEEKRKEVEEMDAVQDFKSILQDLRSTLVRKAGSDIENRQVARRINDLTTMKETLNDVAELLAELVRIQVKQIPKGISKNITVAVSQTPTVITKLTEPTFPWLSFSIANDGPDDVYFQVNSDTPQFLAPIKSADPIINYNYRTAQVEAITLTCKAGTSSVRLFGLA